jgi:hypothetical protein
MYWFRRSSRTPSSFEASRVFVSYCRDDIGIVTQLRDSLTAYGVQSWIDFNLVGGRPWDQQIRKAIKNSGIFLLCGSEALALRKQTYVAKELNLVFERRKKDKKNSLTVLPVALDCPVFPKVQGFKYHDELSKIHQISLSENWSKGIANLLTAIDSESGSVAMLMGQLESNSVRKIIAASRDLGDLGSLSAPAIPRLQKFLAHENEAVQANSAIAIGSIGGANEGTVVALLNAIRSPQAKMGYGVPVIVATISKLAQTNVTLFEAFLRELTIAIDGTKDSEAASKLKLAKEWLRERPLQEKQRDKRLDALDAINMALSNAANRAELSIVRNSDDMLTIERRREDGGNSVLVDWSFHFRRFLIETYEKGEFKGHERIKSLDDTVRAVLSKLDPSAGSSLLTQ